MKNRDFDSQIPAEGFHSNIIFGTSSDDIEKGLDNGSFTDSSSLSGIDDKDIIVNEQQQNEIVNNPEETGGEDSALPEVKEGISSTEKSIDTASLPGNAEDAVAYKDDNGDGEKVSNDED